MGLALGDALGTTLEFREKDSYEHIDDMVGGGPFSLEVGMWTDDTSMALCLADSLLERGKHDPKDQLDKYVKWSKDGYNSVLGYCFDIGITVTDSLNKYLTTGEEYPGSTCARTAGNGSLMRMAPTIIFHSKAKGFGDLTLKNMAILSSKTTHACPSCLEASEMFAQVVDAALCGQQDKRKILADLVAEYPLADASAKLNPEIHKLRTKIQDLQGSVDRDDVRGTGYVIDSIHAALWCFLNSDDFREGALLAANLGDDADTTAAIYGQIAGAYYGYDALPEDWIAKIYWRYEIESKAQELSKAMRHLWY